MESPEPFQITVNRFHYPGWRAWVDGREVEVTPETEWGRFTFPVPAGRHHITVRFGETPLRLAADILSGLSLLALIVVSVALAPLPGPRPSPVLWKEEESERDRKAGISSPPSRRRHRGGPAGGAVPSCRRCARRLTGAGVRGVAFPTHIVYDGQFHLLGWDPIPSTVPANHPVPVGLYWQDTTPGGPDYRVQPDIVDGDHQVWNSPAIPPASFRSAPRSPVWPPGQYAITALNIHPLMGTPPGVYTVTLVVFDGETLLPYTAYQDGQALGPEITLGQIRLTRPTAPPSLEALGIPATATTPAWGPIRLLRGGAREQTGRPGDPSTWNSTGRPPQTRTEPTGCGCG